jgi:site-specific DNA-methyltransferase (adenine-specific)
MTDPVLRYGNSRLYKADCFDWLREAEPTSIHGVVTDPPYGLVEYTSKQLRASRNNKGVWRLPRAFDGYQRSPVPRFTELSTGDIGRLHDFFHEWGQLLLPVLVPGAHVLVASNPLLSYVVAAALDRAGLEHRGKVSRLVHTMRGGDRPKYAHEQFPGVSVIPRSMHEPWVLFRKPLDGPVRENLQKWGTGGLRRPPSGLPFGDVIPSGRAEKAERALAPHPTLKPQAFLRQVVRAILPLGTGTVLDTFSGSGSTLAAAEAVGYESIGVEKSAQWVKLARRAIPALAELEVSEEGERIKPVELDPAPSSTALQSAPA